jgi:hAT family C-terminal dimerisation region
MRIQQQDTDDINFSGWQGIPALSKLHAIAVWVRSSSHHSDAWRDDVGMALGIDNTTRWSSWYKVIDVAIKMQDRITLFLSKHDTDLNDNTPTSSDWELLRKTHTFLQPFTKATLWAEGAMSSISQSLRIMDALLLHCENAKKLYSAPGTRNERMLYAIDMDWFVLNKYYTLSDDSPVYAAAVLLDPTKRAAYIKKNWPLEWHEASISAAREIWEKEYNRDIEPQQSQDPIDVAISANEDDDNEDEDEFELLLKSMDVQPDNIIPANGDSFDAFIYASTTALDKGCTPLQWWCRIEQRLLYPRLCRIAIDILPIPAESAEAERSFSGARRTASWDRLRITPQNLEKVVLVASTAIRALS